MQTDLFSSVKIHGVLGTDNCMTGRHITKCVIFLDTYPYLLNTKILRKKFSGRLAVDFPHTDAVLIV